MSASTVGLLTFWMENDKFNRRMAERRWDTSNPVSLPLWQSLTRSRGAGWPSVPRSERSAPCSERDWGGHPRSGYWCPISHRRTCQFLQLWTALVSHPDSESREGRADKRIGSTGRSRRGRVGFFVCLS
ncbi:hypothetical protein GY45DRAFT_807600 [Cubamyces sp. BRFM 1775]|nr:hypothetical protein GY45DRAFT_807600 [Cubamyces sp. BRFM 1775]